MTSQRRAVIVGASIAGLSAARTLREEGWTGQIVMIGDEPHPPYDRPPLSKQVLQGRMSAADVGLATADELVALGIELRLGEPASALDTSRRLVFVGDDSVAFDVCLLAVGVRPRTLAMGADLAGIHALRTLDDAIRLRRELVGGASLVVIGGGFIGLEVAASARSLGCEVTVVEAQPCPLASSLGEELGRWIQDMHEREGVTFRCGVTVEALHGSTAVQGLTLSDGSRLHCDAVVVGIGATSNTEWLMPSGLALADGILCDEFGRSSEAHVYAAGDVARWWHPRTLSHARVEHWSSAVDQGRVAAINMLHPWAAPARAYDQLPYFWSDQFHAKIQGAGHWSASDLVLGYGDVAQRRILRLFGRAGRVCGIIAINAPGPVASWRRRIAAGCSWSEAVADARSFMQTQQEGSVKA